MADEHPGDEELLRAAQEDPDDEPGEIIAVEDAEEEPAAVDDGGEPRAGTITSHILSCYRDSQNRNAANSKSTFKAPQTTGHLYMRVGYFDSNGARMFLSPWKDKGTIGSYNTKTHVETWGGFPRRVARAVVVAHFPGYYDVDGSRWASC
jgi:hypothetical protein